MTRLPFRTCLFAAAAALALPVVTVGATTAPAAQGDTSFWSTLQPYGDLRLRYESDHDSVTADGITPRADRTRFRTRARLGVSGAWSKALRFDTRVRNGDPDNQQSPHVTWLQNSGDKGRRDVVTLDRLFVRWTNAAMAATVGRQDLPFWKPHELLWDDDVYLDGAGLTIAKLSAGLPVGLRAGVWRLPDGPASQGFDERSTLTAAQLVLVRDLGPRGKLTIAGGLLAIDDKSSVANPTNDDLDYTVGTLDLEHQFKVSGTSAAVGASLYHNFEDGPAGDPVRGATDGIAVFAKLGRFDQPGDIQFAYYFAEIEKYAVARFFAQDDWFRFGSATQTRTSDYRGHELRLSYMWSKKVNLVARAYFVDTISTREKGDRARLDINFKF